MGYKCIKQHDSTDCGLACIASLAWYFGNKISIKELKKYVAYTGDGISIFDLCETARKVGLRVTAFKKTNDFNEKELTVPCIVNVKQEDGLSHFVIIYRVKKEKILIADPAVGLVDVDRKDFFNSVYSEKSQYMWTGIIMLVEQIPGYKKYTCKKEKIFDKYVDLLKNEWIRIGIVIILSVLSMTISILSAFYFGWIIDDIVPNSLYYTLIFLTTIMVGLIILKTVFDWLRAENVIQMSRSISIRLCEKYYRHILELPLSFFETQKSGDILSRFQDIEKIQETLITSILLLPIDLIFICVVSIMLLTKNAALFSIMLIVCVLYVFVIILYKNRYSVLNTAKMAEYGRNTTNYVDTVEGVQTIKSNTCEDEIFISGRYRISRLQNIIVKLGEVENEQSAWKSLINGIGGIIVLGIGAFIVMGNDLSIGELVTYNMLVGYLLKPVADITNMQSVFQAASVSMERLQSIFEIEREMDKTDSKEKAIPETFDIKIENLTFGFDKNHHILNNINMKVGAGEKIAIIGTTGSGKTTLAKLLMKFYAPQSGGIYLGNKNIASLNDSDVRHLVGYVSQEEFIFTGSVKHNLCIGNDGISDEQIIQLGQKLGVDEFISMLPNKYNTVLHQRGGNLSKGQKQKIAIMRAILRKPKILILDEATSNIDAVCEEKILKYLKEESDMTLILITHNFSTIAGFRKIYVIEQGEIVAQGTHDDIVKKSSV